MLRLFLAIPVSEPVRDALTAIQEEMKHTFRHSRVMWVEPENFHMTLHYIGEVTDVLVASLRHTFLTPIAVPPFVLHLAHVGAFPHPKKPQTLFVATNTHPSLLVVHRRLADLLLRLSLPIDMRTFHPHITLGRVYVQSEVLSQEHAVAPLVFDVSSYLLMQSTLTPTGSVYQILQEYPLG